MAKSFQVSIPLSTSLVISMLILIALILICRVSHADMSIIIILKKEQAPCQRVDCYHKLLLQTVHCTLFPLPPFIVSCFFSAYYRLIYYSMHMHEYFSVTCTFLYSLRWQEVCVSEKSCMQCFYKCFIIHVCVRVALLRISHAIVWASIINNCAVCVYGCISCELGCRLLDGGGVGAMIQQVYWVCTLYKKFIPISCIYEHWLGWPSYYKGMYFTPWFFTYYRFNIQLSHLQNKPRFLEVNSKGEVL